MNDTTDPGNLLPELPKSRRTKVIGESIGATNHNKLLRQRQKYREVMLEYLRGKGLLKAIMRDLERNIVTAHDLAVTDHKQRVRLALLKKLLPDQKEMTVTGEGGSVSMRELLLEAWAQRLEDTQEEYEAAMAAARGESQGRVIDGSARSEPN